MSFISLLLKEYQIDTPVTTKEYIENKALQGNKTIGNIKNKSEFIEDVDISFPQLWYMFNHTDKLKIMEYNKLTMTLQLHLHPIISHKNI